jgi:hypothetical protein
MSLPKTFQETATINSEAVTKVGESDLVSKDVIGIFTIVTKTTILLNPPS